MRRCRVECAIGSLTLLIGIAKALINFAIWQSWKDHQELGHVDYYIGILKYVAIAGIALWCFEQVSFDYRTRYMYSHSNVQVNVPGVALGRGPFIYYPTTWNAGFFLEWDICTILTGALVDLPVVVLAYNVAECTAFAEDKDLEPELFIAAIALSILDSVLSFGASLYKAIWNCTLPPEHLIDPRERNCTSCDRKTFLIFWSIFILGFSGGFLVPAFMSIKSVLVYVVNCVVILFIVSLFCFMGRCIVVPKLFVAWVGIISCGVFAVVIIVGSVALKQLVAIIDNNANRNIRIPVCLIPAQKL